MLTTLGRDPKLDTPLDLRGEPLFVDDTAHSAKLVKVRANPTPERRQGLGHSLTLHARDSARLVGFDIAHPVRKQHTMAIAHAWRTPSEGEPKVWFT